MKKYYDVIIIGAGAAGMAAAISCGMNNPAVRIAVLDKNSEVGRKLRATGNGRCNISNTQADMYGEVLEFLHYVGIETRTYEDTGLIYPMSESASDVAEILREKAYAFGCEMLYGMSVSGIECDNGEYIVSGVAAGRRFALRTGKLIVAAGGKAGPAYGTTGDAYRWMRELGHSVVTPIPVLAPIECGEDDMKSLAGVRAKGIVNLYRRGERVFSEAGEVQFTKDGLSGICIFNATRLMRYTREEGVGIYEIGIDLLGEAGNGEVVRIIRDRYEKERRLAESYSEYAVPKAEMLLSTIVKGRLAQYIMRRCGVDGSKAVTELSDMDIELMQRALEDLRFKPTGIKGWKEAQCTSGGVSRGEVHEWSSESKKHAGLYIAGELLDYDGPCGGYNLNHAFLTGMRAGRSAAENSAL